MDNHSFIIGLGWVDNSTITCRTCGDQGFIVTKVGDAGGPEDGPMPFAEEFEYCTCEAGEREKREDEEFERGYEEAKEASLLAHFAGV